MDAVAPRHERAALLAIGLQLRLLVHQVAPVPRVRRVGVQSVHDRPRVMSEGQAFCKNVPRWQSTPAIPLIADAVDDQQDEQLPGR